VRAVPCACRAVLGVKSGWVREKSASGCGVKSDVLFDLDKRVVARFAVAAGMV
jgi:hypothetical protein